MTFPTLTTLISSNHSKLTKTKLIAVDLCNTLAKVNEAIEDIFGPVPNPSILYHPATPPSFWANPKNRIAREIFLFAEPFPGSAKALNRVVSQGWEIVYLTSRPEWTKDISIKWLNLNKFPKGPVITTPFKTNWALKNSPALVVEDDPKHINPLQHIVPVFVPAHPWNEGFAPRFRWERRIAQCP